QQPVKGSTTRNLTALAGNSVMQGTPDYLSPEQALDFHSADIRADIYSLGCTFYFLLIGQPPFPGGTLPEKLLKHHSVEPQLVTELRKDVPPEMAAVVKKMLAKRPPDRFQTPGEVARVLTMLMGSLKLPMPPGTGAGPAKRLPAPPMKRGSTLKVPGKDTPSSDVSSRDSGASKSKPKGVKSSV